MENNDQSIQNSHEIITHDVLVKNDLKFLFALNIIKFKVHYLQRNIAFKFNK